MAGIHEKPESSSSPLKRALVAVRDMRKKLEAAERSPHEPIAIVGMACRFPGEARNLEGYWRVLENGIDAVGEVPADRWDTDAYYDPDPDAPGKMYTREGGFIQDIDKFDADFFGITPREAARMDPQQRLLLEASWQALESACIDPKSLNNSVTGVFVGISTNEYMQLGLKNTDPGWIDAYTGTGGALSVAAGRVSYFLGLHGPAVSLDTACSSSLVAIDIAVNYLRAKKCRLALAGGVNLMLSPESSVYLCSVRALSPDGRCKTFDESADGYGRGEGCGIIVLKRMHDALADGDRILALILGSATNHDGHSAGLTVPNGAAQREVINAALADARIDPSQVNYIETHGTGTSLGDPIEIRALDSLFKNNQQLLIGTAKTNIGHLEAAAGVAAVIKVVLAFQNRLIPPNLHFHHPSAHIPWENMSMRVPTRPTPWPEDITSPIAGVSSFGFSGTNAHLILQAAPATDRAESAMERPLHILALSARNDAALHQLTTEYASHLRMNDAPSTGDVCHTAGVGRAHFQKRLALLASGHEELISGLDAFGHEDSSRVLWRGESVGSERPPKVAFLFTGQGSQYQGMGRTLYETQPTFRKIMDRCDELLRPRLKRSLISVLYPRAGAEDEGEGLLNQTEITQPALFALEYALAQLWRSWGIEPAVVMGHSVGEYVAACVAGVYGLEDGLDFICERSRLMQALPGGGRMAAVFADAQLVADIIAGHEDAVSIAAINGPRNTVISGVGEVIEFLIKRLESEGVKTQNLTVSHGFHSPLMTPMLADFEEAAAKISFSVPQIKFISNLTGGIAVGEEISQPGWWGRHVREPVRFADSMRLLERQKVHFYLEIGPSPILLGMGRQCVSGEDSEWLPSLRRGRDDWNQMLESLAKLYVKGAPVDWIGFDRDYVRRKVALPSYSFQRDSFWMDKKAPMRRHTATATNNDAGTHPLLGGRLRSPLIDKIVYSSSISPDVLPYLKDHNVFGLMVFPATGFLELALTAAHQLFFSSSIVIEHMTIGEPIVFKHSQQQIIQTVLSPNDFSGAHFQIYSCESPSGENTEDWILHASGTVRPAGDMDQTPAPVTGMLEGLRLKCGSEVEVAEYYQRLRNLGIDYGPGFRTVGKLWFGQGQGLAQLRLADDMLGEAEDYQLHPAMLDGCLQVLGAASMMDTIEANGGPLYLPIEFGKLTVTGKLGPQCWCYAKISKGSTGKSETITADLSVLDERGNFIARIEGLIAKRAASHTLQRISEKQMEDWLYELSWRLKEPSSTKQPQTNGESGSWLVFADRSGVADKIIFHLNQTNQKCIAVYPGNQYQSSNGEHVVVDPLNPDDFHKMIEDKFLADHAMIAGVIHLWSLDSALTHHGFASIEASQKSICGSVLHLIQSLGSHLLTPSFRFWLITRGAQAVGLGSVTPHILQATFWAMARVIAIEHPELSCTRVDLDPNESDDPAPRLINEIHAAGNEDQIAFRDRDRYVARFIRLASKSPESESSELALPRGESYRLVVHQRGVIDNIKLVESQRQVPGPGQVELRVHVTGLNFRDVLNVLGMYPGDAGQLGSECVGSITAIGKEVTQYRVGEKVIALASGSFSKYVVTSADLLMPIPSGLNDEAAASLPIAFLTAYYGLHHLAGMKKGHRVLIHAAAGGVGMAAVQLAQQAGAEVFGTAGSPEKQQFLRAMGVEHVMHSRTLAFADEIMKITGGTGVDIVLNALAGDFIPKSLSVLASGGKFIEIGKADIWDREKVARVNPGVDYAAFDLADVIMKAPHLVGDMFQQIANGFKEKKLKSLPLHTFYIKNITDAFRFMAQARHIGKIVVTHRDASETAPEDLALVHSDATYLITGGLGSLGLIVADWLVAEGARHIVLMGRSGPSDKSLAAIESLKAKGASVVIARGDISQSEDLAKVFKEIEAAGLPLRGIVHAAGVLHDGVLIQQKWEAFQHVFGAKMKGAWLLNEFSRDLPLDFFVLFSSASAVLGSPGQANYASANAFMDGLSHYLRSLGRNSLSINWGPWSAMGMADSLTGRNRNRVLDRGIRPIAPAQGLQALNLLLNRQIPQATVIPVSWPKFLQTFPKGHVPALFEELVQEAQPSTQPGARETETFDLKQRLVAAPESDRKEMLIALVASQAAKVMGLASSKVLDIKTPFNSLGLDSLMAVELRNSIAESVGRSLPASLIYDYATIEALSGYLFEELLADEISALPTENDTEMRNPNESIADEIDRLSQEEMATLLAEKIASLNQGKSE